MIDLSQIEKIYFVRKEDFFNSELCLAFIDSTISKLREEDQLRKIKADLKSYEDFEKVITHTGAKEYFKLKLAIKMAEIGDSHVNLKLIERGIRKVEYVQKDKLLSKHHSLFNFIKGRIYLMHFNIAASEDENFMYSFTGIESLQKSKYYYFLMLNEFLEDENRFQGIDLSILIGDLTMCLNHLCRWSEAFHLVKQDKLVKALGSYGDYAIAIMLDEIQQKTCCTAYPMLYFHIIKHCENYLNAPKKVIRADQQLAVLKTKAEIKVQELGSTLKVLEDSYNEINEEFKLHSQFRQYCLKKNLTLSEHAIFCNCKQSKTDNLQIVTNHAHTQIEWVKPFELLVQKLKNEFSVARLNFFKATTKEGGKYLYSNEITNNFKDDGLEVHLKSELLTSGFRICYGILDKIAKGLLEVFDIKYTNDTYFTNVFRNHKDSLKSRPNRYVSSLYSIAFDLVEKNEFAALKDYHIWRNALEHDVLVLHNSSADVSKLKTSFPFITKFVEYDEFVRKSEHLMQLARSAIFSFVYLVRHRSVEIEQRSLTHGKR